ncbi:MAG: ABC transporter permease [Candidatus Cloacimonetes bacterium]|nr:ABC transporter permease [Candidatus Cloacimonadota bacterium]
MQNESRLKKIFTDNSKYILLVVMLGVSALISNKFFTGANISNLLKQNAGVGIVSLGELLVILTGGIDLSVGAIVSMTSVVVSSLLKAGISIPVAIIFTLFVGLGAGLVNGVLITRFKIIPFIATLATLNVFNGIGLLMSKGRQIFYENDGFLTIGNTSFWYIPLVAIIWLFITIILNLVLEYTKAGRYIKGFGGNKEAVRLSGVNVKRTEMSAYIVSGLFCAIGGILMASRLTLGSNSVGTGWELTAIASVVIGGGRMAGGIGTAGGVVVGTLVMGLIGNIMNLLNVSIYWQQIIKGVIILVAVYSSSSRKKGNSL